MPVELFDRLLGLLFGSEPDEGEPARPTGRTIGGNVDVLDFAHCTEKRTKVLIRHGEVKIPDKDLL